MYVLQTFCCNHKAALHFINLVQIILKLHRFLKFNWETCNKLRLSFQKGGNELNTFIWMNANLKTENTMTESALYRGVNQWESCTLRTLSVRCAAVAYVVLTGNACFWPNASTINEFDICYSWGILYFFRRKCRILWLGSRMWISSRFRLKQIHVHSV